MPVRPTTLALVGLAALGCAAFAPQEKVDYQPRPQQGSRQFNVSRYYEDTCAKCHGSAGEGGGGGTKSLISLDRFDPSLDKPFFDVIREGIPGSGMEAYSTLSDAEVWSLVVHVRELQDSGLRAQNRGPRPINGVFKSQRASYKVETVIDREAGLKTPWAIDWLPDGKMLITERPGRLNVYENGVVTPIEGTPEGVEMGQGGYMEIAVHPNYKSSGWVYLAYAEPGGNGANTKIVRAKIDFSSGKPVWKDEQTIFKAAEATYIGSGVHFGSRIAFDGKGHVFFVMGSRGDESRAQDLTVPNGKICRLNEDGTVPKDNPFVNTPNAIKAIWSYGHRNPQGLVFGLDGTLWATEHAPRGGDELNKIVKGGNYGWNKISFGINYNDTPYRVPWPAKGENFLMPAYRWIKSTGSCGMDVVRGSAFTGWKGDLVIGGLSGVRVERFRMKGGEVEEHEELIYGMGRVRETSVGPDGFVYVALNQPDIVIRLVPAK